MKEIEKLLELSKEAVNSLMRTGGMLNQDLALDLTKTISKIEKEMKNGKSADRIQNG